MEQTKVHPPQLCREIIEAGRDIDNLKEWQEAQNGQIDKLVTCIDALRRDINGWVFKLMLGLTTALASAVIALVLVILRSKP